MRKYHTVVQGIIAAIEDIGPSTSLEVGNYLDLPRNSLTSVISRMNKASPRKPKRLYIKEYVHDAEGLKQHTRAVYDIGDKPDAKRPKYDKTANKRRSEKARERRAITSVFELGTPVKVRRTKLANLNLFK